MDELQVRPEQKEKLKALEEYLWQMGTVAVAFSGGVDSTFLLKVAHKVLSDHAIAVTAALHSFPRREFLEARAFCEKEGIRQLLCKINELEIDGFSENTPDRCYLCKKTIFTKMKELVKEEGIPYLIEGSNVDDEGDYRPGMRAVHELSVESPLQKCGITKEDIRALSRELWLPNWNKPSYACLATRFPYGETITKEKLVMLDKAEQILFDLGFHQVRVRKHGEMARIEVMPEEFGKLVEEETRQDILDSFRELGFRYVSMDLQGYRTGSMNEPLEV